MVEHYSAKHSSKAGCYAAWATQRSAWAPAARSDPGAANAWIIPNSCWMNTSAWESRANRPSKKPAKDRPNFIFQGGVAMLRKRESSWRPFGCRWLVISRAELAGLPEVRPGFHFFPHGCEAVPRCWVIPISTYGTPWIRVILPPGRVARVVMTGLSGCHGHC